MAVGAKRHREELTMPSSTPKQKIAMRIAAAGKSNIGIPQSVGKEFTAADKRRDLAKAMAKSK